MSNKLILCLEESAEKLGITVEDINDLIASGDIKAMGTKKDKISIAELEQFIGANTQNSLDIFDFQRYNPTTSIEVADLSEEEYEQMKRKANGDGSVYFNKERNKWCGAVSLGYDDNGKRIRKVVSGDTQAEVEFKITQLQMKAVCMNVQAQNVPQPINTINPKADILFEDFINEYLTKVKYRTTSRTFENKCNTAKHIKRELGKYKLYELNRNIIEKFINDFTNYKYNANNNSKNKPKKEEYIGQSIIHNVYNLLCCLIRDASTNDLIDKNYTLYLKEPKTKKYTDPKELAFSDEQIKTIIDILKKENNQVITLMVHIALFTGLRPSEILALKFSDFDYEKKLLNVQRNLSENREIDPETAKCLNSAPMITGMKNAKSGNLNNFAYRKLKVNDALIEMVKQFEEYTKTDNAQKTMRKDNDTVDFIFVNHKCELPKRGYHTQQYKRILQKYGYSYSDYNLYKFRHTFCTNAMRLNIDLKTLQMLMGDNTSSVILKYYCNLNEEDVYNGSEKMSSAMSKIIGL